MERMSSNALALEQRREPQSRSDLILRNLLVAVFRLADNEFAHLVPNISFSILRAYF